MAKFDGVDHRGFTDAFGAALDHHHTFFGSNYGDVESALQALSVDEANWLDNFFMTNITPLFFAETLADLEKKIIAGSAGFLDVGALIVLALSLGKLTQDLGTGPFVAQLLQSSLPGVVIPALVFLLSAMISFSTGTSYGTFSIMVPIALPLGAATGTGAIS